MKWPPSLINIASAIILNLGYAYSNVHKTNVAISWYKKALHKYTVVGDSLYKLYYNLGLFIDDRTLLRKSIHLNHKFILPYKELARLYRNDIKKDPNNLYTMKQLLRLYSELMYKDRINSVLYGIKICYLSRQMLKVDSSQKLWILMNINEHIDPISKNNINILNINQIYYIFYFIENCLRFLKNHLITKFLKSKSGIKRFYQYTSTDTLKSICDVNKDHKFNSKDPFKLRLYNSDYMNDPSEGKELFSRMSNIGSDSQKSHVKHVIDSIYHKDLNDSDNLYPSHVYIASLSCVKPLTSDSMPLWERYANSHKGIALGLDVHLHVNSNNNENMAFSNSSLNKSNYNEIPLNLYKVSYNTKKSDAKDIRYLKNIVKYMSKFDNNILKDNHISDLLKLHLDKIRFLFKSSDYKQEKEYRIIEDESKFSNVKFDKGNVKLYIELNNKNNVSAKLDEIVFGNKCKNYYLLPIINKQLGNIKMRKSNIKIR